MIREARLLAPRCCDLRLHDCRAVVSEFCKSTIACSNAALE